MSDVSAELGSSAPRYDFEEIDLDAGSVHADVVRLVPEGSRVLELGPATGYMSEAFGRRGCTVVGIELDPAMAERAERFVERMIVGDLDSLDLEAELGEERFDAIVAADVLEHLRDPLATLTRLRPFLEPDGAFVISIPNVAHGSVRLALLGGHFDYREIGLLDSTHLRFFTRASLEQLLDEAELGLAELHRHELNFDASEVPFDADLLPPAVREEVESDPDARTYQFVVRAVPMPREGLRAIQARLREMRSQLDELDELRAAAERTAELERTLAEVAGREGELRRAVIDAHDQLLRRDEELARLGAEVAVLGSQLTEARLHVGQIHSSAPYRAYSKVKDAPGVRSWRQRRQAALAAELARRNSGA